ncbi:MAG: NAD(P)/FAD-dependent oxidoreductase [Patescibacteria group bacterium]|jgi:protoporphyrinogen oxidase
MENKKTILVIGAGPAGLAAAHEILSKDGSKMVIVVEKEKQVGGISKTFSYKDFYFDAGGHRFFTKNEEVEKLWRDSLGDEFLKRNRLSRIFYRGKFYDYPLKLSNVIKNLGVVESFLVLGSYIKQKFFPYKEENNLEQWISNRFGKRIFKHFFETYTEKLWGIPASQVGADWGAQRIKGLSVSAILKNALFPQKGRSVIKTLIESFDYPKYGVGQMYEKIADNIKKMSGEIWLESAVENFFIENGKISKIEIFSPAGARIVTVDEVISTMPITDLAEKLSSLKDVAVKEAARKLKYRSFLSVCVILDDEKSFPDNWIYIHSKVKMGRIQNFKRWSEFMVPDASKTALGLEYFCNEGDDLWNMEDKDLIKLGMEELEIVGLGEKKKYLDGFVYRCPKSYPVYDGDHKKYLAIIKDFLRKFSNLQTVGRNGLFCYNNMDHSILAGFYAARNVLSDNRDLDVWQINVDEEYHEEEKI